MLKLQNCPTPGHKILEQLKKIFIHKILNLLWNRIEKYLKLKPQSATLLFKKRRPNNIWFESFFLNKLHLFMYLCNLRPRYTHHVRLCIRNPHRPKFGLPLGFIQGCYKNYKKLKLWPDIPWPQLHVHLPTLIFSQPCIKKTVQRKQQNSRVFNYGEFYLVKIICIFTCGEDKSPVRSLLRPSGPRNSAAEPLHGPCFTNVWH